MSNGLIPMLRVFNATARYVDQGGNKRPGAFAIYLEPWHDDIFEFLDLKKNTGKEEQVIFCKTDCEINLYVDGFLIISKINHVFFSSVREICFMPCGFLISSWFELKEMKIGV